jgi:hypothetical protein
VPQGPPFAPGFLWPSLAQSSDIPADSFLNRDGQAPTAHRRGGVPRSMLFALAHFLHSAHKICLTGRGRQPLSRSFQKHPGVTSFP